MSLLTYIIGKSIWEIFVSNITSCQVTECKYQKPKHKIMFLFLLRSCKFNMQTDYFHICQSEMCPWFESRDPSSGSKDWKIRAQSCSCRSQHRLCFWVQQRSTGSCLPEQQELTLKTLLEKSLKEKRMQKSIRQQCMKFFSKPPLSTQVLIQLHSLWC